MMNSVQVQNNMHCELVELKLITLKTTFSEGFCNSLITFNFEEMNIVFWGNTLSSCSTNTPCGYRNRLLRGKCDVVMELIIESC